ncbi:MAG: permease [Synechococcales cyanobacterium RM1_1_8]|nr:permease [Synechococcales cyanobacterium RM1_1_8]
MLSVAQSQPSERAEFIRKTYIHLAGAIAAFTLLQYIFINTGISAVLGNLIAAGGNLGWIAILGAFALIGWLSRSLTARADDEGLQYLGLSLYVLFEALIFAPMIWIAHSMAGGVLLNAALLTLCMFAGLTTIAFTTKKDFSFLGGFLRIGGFVALGFILCGLIFGFQLGLFFSVAMVGFASMAILYDTSKVMQHYSTRHHVAASLELFASVALLFWYILRILMQLNRR